MLFGGKLMFQRSFPLCFGGFSGWRLEVWPLGSCIYSCSSLRSNQGQLKYLRLSGVPLDVSLPLQGHEAPAKNLLCCFWNHSYWLLHVPNSFPSPSALPVTHLEFSRAKTTSPSLLLLLTVFTLKLPFETTSAAFGSSNSWPSRLHLHHGSLLVKPNIWCFIKF